jgi:hypothetical protein
MKRATTIRRGVMLRLLGPADHVAAASSSFQVDSSSGGISYTVPLIAPTLPGVGQ